MGVVALHNHLAVSLQREQACNLVHVDGHVVQGRCLSCDSKALLVKLKSSRELLLLKMLVGQGSELVKLDGVQLLLDSLLSSKDSWVLLINNGSSIEIKFCQLPLFLDIVTLGPPHEELDFQNVIFIELSGVVLELLNYLERSTNILKTAVVLLSLEMDNTNIGEGILVQWI
jgi:hypothetical protein